MSSDGEDTLQLHQQQQRPAAGGTPGSVFRSAPGQPDSGSDSSDEDIGKEFAQAAELHRSSSAGALPGGLLHRTPFVHLFHAHSSWLLGRSLGSVDAPLPLLGTL